MTSIRDIPYEDVKIFLDANGKKYKNKDEAYDLAFDLLNDTKSKGHTTSIIEWMISYNLLQNNVKISIYSIYDIDNMPQEEIDQLSKLLKMKRNNRENIKNILRYLHKLDEKIIIDPDISSLIFPMLNQLELQDIDLAELRYNDVINLLKTHRNKKLVRNFIYSNLDKIIIYNIYYFHFDDLEYPEVIDPDNVNVYNKDIIGQIILDNKDKLRKLFSNEEINNLIKLMKEVDEDEGGEVYTGKSEMYNLTKFTFDLFEIKEIKLAKRVFDISNKLHLYGRSYPYNVELIDHMINTENIITVINWMGDDEFLKNFGELEINYYNYEEYSKDIKNLIEKLTELRRYDLSVRVFKLYIDEIPERILYEVSEIFEIIAVKLSKLKRYDLLIEVFQIYLAGLPINKKNRLTKIFDKIKRAISNSDDDLVVRYIQENEL